MASYQKPALSIEASSSYSAAALNEDDLQEIVQKLADIAIKWPKIGMVLGLRQDILNTIQQEHGHHDLVTQLTNMVSQWLKRNYNVDKFGEPTWEKLAEAVGNKVGGANTALAQEIAETHMHSFHVRSGTKSREMAKHMVSTEQQDSQSSEYNWFCCFKMHKSNSLPQLNFDDDDDDDDDDDPFQFTESMSSQGTAQTTRAIPTWKLKDIKNRSSYHGAMTGKEAVLKLKEHGGNCYLLRYSEVRKSLVITVLRGDEKKPFHFILNITKKDNRSIYEIEGTEEYFDNIDSLLAFYQDNPLTAIITCIGEPYVRECNL